MGMNFSRHDLDRISRSVRNTETVVGDRKNRDTGIATQELPDKFWVRVRNKTGFDLVEGDPVALWDAHESDGNYVEPYDEQTELFTDADFRRDPLFFAMHPGAFAFGNSYAWPYAVVDTAELGDETVSIYGDPHAGLRLGVALEDIANGEIGLVAIAGIVSVIAQRTKWYHGHVTAVPFFDVALDRYVWRWESGPSGYPVLAWKAGSHWTPPSSPEEVEVEQVAHILLGVYRPYQFARGIVDSLPASGVAKIDTLVGFPATAARFANDEFVYAKCSVSEPPEVGDELVIYYDPSALAVWGAPYETVWRILPTGTVTGGGGDGDELVGVSGTDTTPGYLIDKLDLGTTITFDSDVHLMINGEVLSSPGDEQLRLYVDKQTFTDNDEKVKISGNDTTAGYLNPKIDANSGTYDAYWHKKVTKQELDDIGAGGDGNEELRLFVDKPPAFVTIDANSGGATGTPVAALVSADNGYWSADGGTLWVTISNTARLNTRHWLPSGGVFIGIPYGSYTNVADTRPLYVIEDPPAETYFGRVTSQISAADWSDVNNPVAGTGQAVLYKNSEAGAITADGAARTIWNISKTTIAVGSQIAVDEWQGVYLVRPGSPSVSYVAKLITALPAASGTTFGKTATAQELGVVDASGVWTTTGISKVLVNPSPHAWTAGSGSDAKYLQVVQIGDSYVVTDWREDDTQQYYALLAPTNSSGVVAWPGSANVFVVSGRTRTATPHTSARPAKTAAGSNGSGSTWVSIYTRDETSGDFVLHATDQHIENPALNPVHSCKASPLMVPVKRFTVDSETRWMMQGDWSSDWEALNDSGGMGPCTGTQASYTEDSDSRRLRVEESDGVMKPAVDQTGANVSISVKTRYYTAISTTRIIHGHWKDGKAVLDVADCTTLPA
jgi:hypothetical protein